MALPIASLAMPLALSVSSPISGLLVAGASRAAYLDPTDLRGFTFPR
jgi:hypothetical protein